MLTVINLNFIKPIQHLQCNSKKDHNCGENFSIAFQAAFWKKQTFSVTAKNLFLPVYFFLWTH